MKTIATGNIRAFVSDTFSGPDGAGLILAGLKVNLTKGMAVNVGDQVKVELQMSESGQWYGSVEEHLSNPSPKQSAPLVESAMAVIKSTPAVVTTAQAAPPAATPAAAAPTPAPAPAQTTQAAAPAPTPARSSRASIFSSGAPSLRAHAPSPTPAAAQAAPAPTPAPAPAPAPASVQVAPVQTNVAPIRPAAPAASRASRFNAGAAPGRPSAAPQPAVVTRPAFNAAHDDSDSQDIPF